jgi:pimeloyl-ACP methyl ester carboxylesterase
VPDGDPSLPSALYQDPPADREAPAQTLAQAIPVDDVNLNAILYMAAGRGPHPTVLLLHGLPGNEQNIDLAQSMRRAGWNVLTMHYRGSWGGPGVFTFAHCLDDAAAALRWMHDKGADPALRIDPHHIAVVGHSMGGFVAAHTVAEHPNLLGAALLSGVDIGAAFGTPDREHSVAVVDDNVGTSEGLHILDGTTPRALADEARTMAARWCLKGCANRLADRPLLLMTSDDGFAAGSDALGDAVDCLVRDRLVRVHFATDHSYSDCRIRLQIEVLGWLAGLIR